MNLLRANLLMINFRNLIKHYYFLADEYRLKTYEIIKEIQPLAGTKIPVKS